MGAVFSINLAEPLSVATSTRSPAASPQRSAVAGLTSATGTGDVARKAGLLKYMDAL